MIVNKIGYGQNSIKNGVNENKKDVSFKSLDIVIDVGASDNYRGTKKITVYSRKRKWFRITEQKLFNIKGFVNNNPKGFKNDHDFSGKIAKSIDIEGLINRQIKLKQKELNKTSSDLDKLEIEAELKELNTKKDVLSGLSKKDKKIHKISLFLPGTLQEKTALFMANLKQQNGESLINVDLKEILTEVKEQGKVELSKGFNMAKDFILAKDLAATGAGVANNVATHPKFKDRFTKGFYLVVMQAGGGFGSVDVKVKGDYYDSIVDIETDEGGHDLFPNKRIVTGEERLGAQTVSAKTVIKTFAEELGLEKTDVETLMKTGNAQITTQKQIKLNTRKTSKAIEVLKKTGIYDIVEENKEFTTLKVKESKIPVFKNALFKTVNNFADTVSYHAITKLNRGANLYAFSGPLNEGMNKAIQENQEMFGENVTDLRSLTFYHIDKKVGNDNTCNILRKANNFDIVCDKAISIPDNTPGGKLILDGEAQLVRRGEWLQIKLGILKPSLKKPLKQEIGDILKRILKAA